MIFPMLSALLLAATPMPCTVPESMPAPSEMMAGEGDADWCLAGDDIFALAGPDAVPARQVASFNPDTDLAQIVQWRRGPPDPPPTTWIRQSSFPGLGVPQGAFDEILIQRLADHVIAVTVNPAWRVGNALCTGEGGPTTLYLPEGIEPSDADRALIERMDEDLGRHEPGNILCTLFTRDGDGYAMRFRGPQGRPLPEIDDYYSSMRAHVAPPGDFDRHLRLSR